MRAKLLHIYIGKTLFITTIIILVALISMDFFVQFLNELNDIGKNNYGVTQAMWYVLLIMPRDVYQFFPMAGLIGSLLGLGLLASHSELVAMRAAGFSLNQITTSVFMIILLMVLIITLFGELLAPVALSKGEEFKEIARSNGQTLSTSNGLWLRDQNDFIHVQAVKSKTELSGVTRYYFKQEQLIQIAFANQALYNNGVWQLSNEVISQLTPDHQVKVMQKKSDVWSLKLNPNVLQVKETEPQAMSLLTLYHWIHYRKANNLQYSNYALQFWQRLVQPLSTCVMMLLAIPFIFGPLRSANMGLRLVAGIVVGFSFYILNQIFGPVSLYYQIPPILGALAPTLIFAMVGGIIMRKMH